MDTKKEYRTIDLLKLIFAIMIVAIHTNLLNVNESYPAWMISSLLFRLGVPFFFVVSGFFLADKLFIIPDRNSIECQQITKNYGIKMLPPLLFWGGVQGFLFK